MYKLEILLSNMQETVTNIFSDTIGGYRLETSQSFVAIAAPSMEGKTQSSFVFERVKPLYFPLIETSDTDSIAGGQKIYKNFKSHARCLKECAEEDLKVLPGKVTATALLEAFRSTPLWTLGFLVKLVHETESKSSDEDWMHFHSKRRNFSFSPTILKKLKSRFFDGYVLFLDEFFSSEWTVFVRNLASSIGLKCVVSNTNTKIANVVGTESMSGTSERSVWSVVVAKLDCPTWEFMKDEYNLDDSITLIIGSRLEDDPVHLFMKDFQNIQLKHLRPGMAIAISKALAAFASTVAITISDFTLGALIDFVMKSVRHFLVHRKQNIQSADSAFLAKLGLLIPESYVSVTSNRNRNVSVDGSIEFNGEDDVEKDIPDDYQENVEKFINKREYLEHHLYHLCNPQIQDFWIFLTFIAKGKRVIQVFDGRWINWDHEYTFFNPNEILTILTCLCIPSHKTVGNLLNGARISQQAHSAGYHDTENNTEIVSPGNLFEVTAASVVVDASQHSFTHSVFNLPSYPGVSQSLGQAHSFKGQMGVEFISNVIMNLILSPIPRDFSVQIPSLDSPYNLSAFLSSCLIPFLYGINNSIPIIDRLSSLRSEFYLGTFQRTANKAQVDGSFPITISNGLERTVYSECKNIRKTIGSGTLRLIMNKILDKPDAGMAMIFCTQLKDFENTNSAFKTLCQNRRINVYRVRKTILGFELLPLYGESLISSNPIINCLIFETVNINKRS